MAEISTAPVSTRSSKLMAASAKMSSSSATDFCFSVKLALRLTFKKDMVERGATFFSMSSPARLSIPGALRATSSVCSLRADRRNRNSEARWHANVICAVCAISARTPHTRTHTRTHKHTSLTGVQQ